MKNLIYLFVMALMAISCGKENTTPSDPTPAPQPDNITLASGTDTAPVISENGGTVTVSFTANTSWTATVNATDGWCTVSPASGNAGNGSITITVKGSTSTDIRTASVVIKAGTANQTITVVQKAKVPDELTLTPGVEVESVVGSNGDTLTVSFTANTSWTAKVSENVDWCTVTPSSGGAGNSTITITVKENTSTVARSTSVVINAGTVTQTIKVEQKAKEPDYITLASGTDIAPVISGNGGTVTISFTANTSWTASVNGDSDWCVVSPASGNAGNGSITITVKGSTSTDIRTASVIIKAGTANQTITIVQKAKAQDDYITLAAGTDVNPTVSADGGTINVSFTTNCSWMTTVSGNSDICTVAPSSGEAGSHTITITVKENTSTVDRSRVVTIKAGSATQTINVNQPAKAKEPGKITLADGTDNYPVVPSDGGNISISFTTNTSWSVEVVGNANWLTVTPTSGGAGSHTITINVAKNATGSTRTNNIIIKAGAKIEKIVVKQEAAGQDKITFATGTNTSPAVSADGGAVTISFTTNVSWEAAVTTSNADWCKVTPSSGAAGNGTITITVEKNTTANARYANVRVMAGSAVEWIYIQQNKLTGNEGIKPGENLP